MMFTKRDAERRTTSRPRQPWPADRPFKILSLDGGGIRGIFSAAVVKNMSEELSEDERLADYFDLIAGTSTGGIIAIALGLGISPSLIFKLYDSDGKKLFPPFWTRHAILRFARRFRTSLYNYSALEKLLRREFGSSKFGDSSARLLIPAFVAPAAQIAIFKTDHHADYRRDWKTPAWEVARATSAAPTFFAGHRYNESYFLDGGLFANNPIMLAIVEAVHAYDVALDQIQVLSVGTGNKQPTVKQSAIRAGMFGWRDALSTAMYLTTDTALSQARLLLGFDAVVRVQPSDAASGIELDDWASAHKLMPADAQARFAEHRDAILPFLAAKVTSRERHFT
jgi:patatin-like phospholipase/acyl hydrolase